MIDWLKNSLEERLQISIEKYSTANKCNDTYTMTGMKFIKAELESILSDIKEYEERVWKQKILTAQVNKEFSTYNLSKSQVEQMVSFIISQNLSVSECKELIQIVMSQKTNLLQKKEDQSPT